MPNLVFISTLVAFYILSNTSYHLNVFLCDSEP